MTAQMKNDFIKAFSNFLEVAIPIDDPQPKQQNINDNLVELLTIKECTREVSGLSEHAIRQLVTKNKIPYVRVGESKRGKILIDKKTLFNYLKSNNVT